MASTTSKKRRRQSKKKTASETHSQQTKFIKRASEVSGAAAEEYEQKFKDQKYAKVCEKQGLEVYGTWGKKAEPILKFISKAVANRKGMDEERAVAFLQQACSVLQRHNVRALLRHRDPEAQARHLCLLCFNF